MPDLRGCLMRAVSLAHEGTVALPSWQ